MILDECEIVNALADASTSAKPCYRQLRLVNTSRPVAYGIIVAPQGTLLIRINNQETVGNFAHLILQGGHERFIMPPKTSAYTLRCMRRLIKFVTIFFVMR
jgi:hypothetical protein